MPHPLGTCNVAAAGTHTVGADFLSNVKTKTLLQRQCGVAHDDPQRRGRRIDYRHYRSLSERVGRRVLSLDRVFRPFSVTLYIGTSDVPAIQVCCSLQTEFKKKKQHTTDQPDCEGPLMPIYRSESGTPALTLHNSRAAHHTYVYYVTIRYLPYVYVHTRRIMYVAAVEHATRAVFYRHRVPVVLIENRSTFPVTRVCCPSVLGSSRVLSSRRTVRTHYIVIITIRMYSTYARLFRATANVSGRVSARPPARVHSRYKIVPPALNRYYVIHFTYYVRRYMTELIYLF